MSEVKVDKISPKTGTAMTVGDSGDTFTVPSGATLTVAGALNVTGTTSLADGTVAVAELDIDGATDIGAGIADADLLVIDDGAAGANRKTAASRLKTYILADNSIDSDMYVDGSIDAAHMSANSIDSDQYVDGSIDLAHMSSESVDEDNLHISNAGSNDQFLQKQSGNAGGLTWATAGGDMTPAFSVYKASTQSIGNASATLVTFDTEVFDTDSAFASNKFTVPSGEGGKYWINSWIRSDNWGAARMLTKIYVNGAQKVFLENDGAGGSYVSSGGSVILDLSATDYVEIYYYHNQGGSQNIGGSSGDWKSFFEGFKLLGV